MLPAARFIWALSYLGSVHAQLARDDFRSDSRADDAASTPSFSFSKINEMTACTPATIPWTYVGSASNVILEMALFVTNNGVAQPSAPPSTAVGTFSTTTQFQGSRRSSLYRRDIITKAIVERINPALGAYTWPLVNVPTGWYVLNASLAFTSPILSQPFYVDESTDTSCLASTSTTSSSPSGSTTATSSTSASPTGPIIPTLPVNAVSGSKVNRGAIAGGVIGGLAILAAAIAAFFYLRYASAASGPRTSSPRRNMRKWGGLGSIDSKTNEYPSTSRAVGTTSNRHHSQSDSVGPISLDSDVYMIGNVGIDSRPSRIDDGLEEQDEVNSYFSPSQEKFSSPTSASPIRSPFSDPGHGNDAVPLGIIPPLPVTRDSSTSTSHMHSSFSRPRSHPASPYPGSPTQQEAPFSSSANNNTSSSLSHPESSYAPSPSPAFTSGTSQTTAESPPPARRSSTGEPLTRRTPRKPVPQYNPTDPALASPPPMPVSAPHDSDSSREGSLRGGVPGAQLSHKASFGAEGRQVHYLIPDMPPPQRN